MRNEMKLTLTGVDVDVQDRTVEGVDKAIALDRRKFIKGVGFAVLTAQCLSLTACASGNSPGDGNQAADNLIIHSSAGTFSHVHDLLIPYAVLNAPPLQAGKRFDLINQLRPFALRKPIQLVGIPAQDLCELKNQKRALIDGNPLRLGNDAFEPRSQAGQIAAFAEMRPCDVLNGQSQQQEPHGNVAQ